LTILKLLRHLDHFKTLAPKYKTVTYKPFGFNKRMLETVASADLYVGKGATSSIAEPTFFGVPSIISGATTDIEVKTTRYFVNKVGSAMKIFKPAKIVAAIKKFVNNPELLKPYINCAIADRKNYGAEAGADFLWKVLQEKKLV